MTRKRLPPLAAKLALRMFLVMWAVSLITFGLIHLSPGDPAEMILVAQSEAPSGQKVEELRRRLGLDQPVWRQYWSWLQGIARLDLGRSFRTGEPVLAMVLGRLSATVQLALTTLGLLILLSTATGALCALLKDSWLDRADRLAAILSMAVPNYWLGLLLIYFFALKLGLFPVFGREGYGALVLPTLSLGLAAALIQGRILRTTLLEVMGQDYVRFARAKGLGPKSVFYRHVLGAALPPVLTMWGTSLGRLLGGAVLVETVFAWPGLGRLTVEAVINRDLPVVQGSVLLMALAFVAANFLVDLLCGFINPKLTKDHQRRTGFAG